MTILPALSGVYLFTNLRNGKLYVGSSVDIKDRVRGHMGALRHDRHSNPHLQAAFNAFGQAAFAVSVLELCDESALRDCEQKHLDALRCYDRTRGYNICASAFGKRHSAETKARIKAKAQCRTEEQRARYALSQMGRKYGEATKAKHSAARTGRKHSDEAKAKIAESNRRRVLSAETRAKIGEANRNPSVETREKLGAAKRGKPLPLWHREKIAATLRSKPAGWRKQAKIEFLL